MKGDIKLKLIMTEHDIQTYITLPKGATKEMIKDELWYAYEDMEDYRTKPKLVISEKK